MPDRMQLVTDMSAELVEQAVREYIEQHPEFTPPEKSQHPLVLALTESMHHPMVVKFGGIVEFWWILLEAAKVWFKPNEDSYEYTVFHGRLIGACGLGSEMYEFKEIWDAYVAWRDYGVH